MAPEQATAGEVTAATDVFALGQTAAFAALGEPLYGDGPAATVLNRIVHSEPELSLLPEQLRPLIAKCLAAEPDERITLAEIVEWCRQRLGRDADAGGGPAVWREVAGPEVTVPAPAPDPTRVHTIAAARMIPAHTGPLLAQPQLQTRPLAPGGRSARRRRTALVAGAAVAGGALLLTGLTWMLHDMAQGLNDRHKATSSAPGPTGSAGSARSSGSALGSGSASASAAGAGTRSPEPSSPSPTAPATPRPVPYPQQWPDEKTSISLEEPVAHKNRKGDTRFDCKQVGCALQSDTSDLSLLYSKPGATYDSCHSAVASADTHRLPLAAVAPGSEICVQGPSEAIGLLVVQVKSTALWDKPGISFLTADMTVWRKA